MHFEELRFASWCVENGVDGVSEIFTSGNDIEHAFCKSSHLQICFHEKSAAEIENLSLSAIAQKRDDLVAALDTARNVLKDSLYDCLTSAPAGQI